MGGGKMSVTLVRRVCDGMLKGAGKLGKAG
jgi:hypothetical protein